MTWIWIFPDHPIHQTIWIWYKHSWENLMAYVQAILFVSCPTSEHRAVPPDNYLLLVINQWTVFCHIPFKFNLIKWWLKSSKRIRFLKCIILKRYWYGDLSKVVKLSPGLSSVYETPVTFCKQKDIDCPLFICKVQPVILLVLSPKSGRERD